MQKYNCLKPVKVELSELLGAIEQGATFRPCAVSGASDKGFISGQLIGIDIDNDTVIKGKKAPLPPDKQLSMESAIETAKGAGLYPVFAYRTFSAKPLHDKYRLVFCLNRPITDPDQWKHCYKRVAAVFQEEADPACKNPARVFFGTNRPADYIDLEARIDVETLLADYVPPTVRKAPTMANTGHQKAVFEGGLAVDVISAVQLHDFDFIRKATNSTKPRYFKTRAEMFDYIYTQISLPELLNVSEGKKFRCLIPDHEDQDPSASVFRADDKKWLYKCQSAKKCPSQGRPLTIKMLFEHVGGFQSESAVIEFIRKSFNLHLIETDYTRAQKENIDEIIQAVSGTDDLSFSAICPTAAKNIRFCKNLYVSILCYAKNRIMPDSTGEGNFMFFMPIKHFVKTTEGVKSVDKTQKYTKLLIYHRLLEIVPFEELPKDIQKGLKARQTNGRNTCQYYRIPSWVHPHLLRIEAQAKRWKANNYRVNAISYEGFYRAEGEDVANWLYPQRKHKALSAESDTRHQFLVDILLGIIQKQGYATEKLIFQELKQALADRGYTYSEYYAESQIKKSITEAVNTYGLTRTRCNADLKKRFDIAGNGYPTIIFFSD